MRPGQAAPASPISDRIQREQQADAAWSAMSGTGSVNNILAANAASNQDAVRNAVSGGGSSGSATFRTYPTPNTISASAGGGASAGANPFNMPLTFAPNTAGYFVRATAQHQAPNNAGIPPAGIATAAGGGAGLPPQPPNMAATPPGWGGGMPGQRPPPPATGGTIGAGGGGGGTGGGGGGGGGGGTGGGGGGGNLPGVIGGWFGMRNTGSALGGGMFNAAIGAEIGKEIYFAPQTIAGLENSWLGKTAQARSYIDQTSIMGQNGGFDSRDFRTNLRRATERGGDDWLLRNGLGADEAAQMVAGLGVVPRSTEQATSAARLLANARTTQGLSGIPPAALTGMLRDMMGVGATTLDRMPSMTADIGAIMKQTAQTGQDQLKVLRSIDSGVVTLSTQPGAAAAIDPVALFQANQRFISTPAGMAGVAGEQSISSTQSAFGSVGSNPARTIVASGMTEKLKTEDDLRKFFGPDAWEQFTSSPVGRELADTYLRDIKAGNQYGAMLTLSRGLMQDPTLAASASAQNAMISNPIARQYGSDQSGLTLASQASMSNMSEAQVIAFRQSLAKGQASGIAANNPLNLSAANQPGLIGAKRVADGQMIGIFPNMATGIAASVNQLRDYEKSGLMTPRELVMKWSGKHASEAYVKSVAEAMGVGADTKVDMNNPDMARGFIQGAQPFETGPGRVSRADINAGVDLAFGRKSANPNLREDGSPDPNVPAYNETVSTAKNDVLHSGSERTLRQGQNLNERVNEISDTWRAIVWAVENLATAVRTAATVQGNTPLNTIH